MKLAIVDYGAGNLKSVANALTHLGAQFKIAETPEAIEASDAVLFPGVGHFGQMATSLDELRLRSSLLAKIGGGAPFLGICVGMQALYKASEESPEAQGLGVFPGEVRKLRGNVRVPHLGWDDLETVRDCPLLKGIDPSARFYFANSFAADLGGETAATCAYGDSSWAAIVRQGSLFGVQFHPEKSGENGLRLLKNFLEIAGC